MSRKILVTGGEGFIGSHLVNKLRKSDYKAVVVDRKSGIDIRDKKKLEEKFKQEKPEVVIHLAAEAGVRQSFDKPQDYIETNINGTYNVLLAAAKFKAGQIIFSSSSSVYGSRSGRQRFKEDDQLSPISVYAATKVAGEHLCRLFCNNYRLKVTVLRLFTVYGPNNRRDMAAYKFTRAIDKGQTIELYGQETERDFTYVDDIVEGIMLALKKPYRHEVFNLGTGRPVAVAKLVRAIEKAMGKTAKIKKTSLPKGDVPITMANADKAKNKLGWKAEISLETGVKRLVDWYNRAHV